MGRGPFAILWGGGGGDGEIYFQAKGGGGRDSATEGEVLGQLWSSEVAPLKNWHRQLRSSDVAPLKIGMDNFGPRR